jgi:hypothetical protein
MEIEAALERIKAAGRSPGMDRRSRRAGTLSRRGAAALPRRHPARRSPGFDGGGRDGGADLRRAGVPIVPQGGNTGLVGGGVPPEDGHNITLAPGRMNRIRAIDPGCANR